LTALFEVGKPRERVIRFHFAHVYRVDVGPNERLDVDERKQPTPVGDRGLTSGEVVAHCGQPVQRYVTSSLNSRTNPDPAQPNFGAVPANRYNGDTSTSYRIQQDEDYQEDWIYDFGDDDTIYVAHFFNGTMSGFERRNR